MPLELLHHEIAGDIGSHIASLGLTFLICEYQEGIRVDDSLRILWFLILVVRLRNGLLGKEL